MNTIRGDHQHEWVVHKDIDGDDPPNTIPGLYHEPDRNPGFFVIARHCKTPGCYAASYIRITSVSTIAELDVLDAEERRAHDRIYPVEPATLGGKIECERCGARHIRYGKYEINTTIRDACHNKECSGFHDPYTPHICVDIIADDAKPDPEAET